MNAAPPLTSIKDVNDDHLCCYDGCQQLEVGTHCEYPNTWCGLSQANCKSCTGTWCPNSAPDPLPPDPLSPPAPAENMYKDKSCSSKSQWRTDELLKDGDRIFARSDDNACRVVARFTRLEPGSSVALHSEVLHSTRQNTIVYGHSSFPRVCSSMYTSADGGLHQLLNWCATDTAATVKTFQDNLDFKASLM